MTLYDARMRWILIASLLAACGGSDGGSCPEYMQISNGTFSKTPTTLTWTLEVVALPATLTFNQADVPTNYREYQWGVEIDTDHNGEPNFEVSATHSRQNGAAEIVTGDILSVTQEDLWTVQGNAEFASGDITASLSGNTFTFSVLVSEDPGLADVTDVGQSTWITSSVSGSGLSDQCTDSWKP
jgi:hypothetical protein